MRGFSQKQKRSWAIGVFAACMVGIIAGHVSSEPTSANQIRDVKIGQNDGKTVVTISGSKRPSFTAFKLNSPDRLIIDIADSHVLGIPTIIENQTPLVGGVAVSEYSVKGQPVCRVMINFKKTLAYRVRVKGNRLVASMTDTPEQPDSATSTPIIEDALEAARQADEATARAEKEAARAKEQAEKAKRLAAQQTERAQAKAKSASIKARAEANRAKEEAAKARREAEIARKEAELARKEAEIATRRAKELAEQARAEAEQVKKQAENAVAKATLAKKKAREETSAARAEAQRTKKEADIETNRVREQATAAIEKAALEVQLAREQAEKARQEAEAHAASERTKTEKEKEHAYSEMERARQEIEVLKKRESTLQGELEKAIAEVQTSKEETVRARAEASEAKANFDAAVRAQKSKELKADKYKSTKMAETEKTIAQYRDLVAKSEHQVTLEKLKRQQLEKKVDLLSKKLALAENATRQAEASLAEAKSKVTELKKEATWQFQLAQKAEQEAEAAVVAQKVATENYAQAAKQEKQQLLTILKQKEKETVQAQRTLAEAQNAKLDAERSLARAQFALSRAERQAKEAVIAQSQVESSTKKELDQWKQRVSKAELAMAQALQAAEDARQREHQATLRVREIEQRAEETTAEALREADRRVIDAKKRLLAAEKAKEQATAKEQETEKLVASLRAKAVEAESRSKDLNRRVIQAEQDALLATQKAQKIEKDLAQAKEVIAEQEKKIADLAKRENADTEPPVFKEENELTQEELRLVRLAKLRGEKPPRFRKLNITPPVSRRQNQVKNIDFKVEGDSQKIVITTTNPIIYSATTDENVKATLTLKDAKLAPILERTLDVTDFGGLIGSVSSFQQGNDIQIEVAIARLAKNTISKKQNTIEWTFKPQSPPIIQSTDEDKDSRIAGPIPKRSKGSRTIAREDSSVYAHSFERTAAVSTKPKKNAKKRYTGRHIDLDFKDADIHNILRLLSDVGRVNIITADDVRGTVTIRMRDVAWDHALDVILQAKHLGMVREGNLIRVAPVETLEQERELELARRKQQIQLEPLETRLIPVSYAEASELLPQANGLITERGSLAVDTRTNVIIARDTQGSLNQVEALIRNLDTQTPQVLIESRIVEATSQYAREIGIQWGGDFTASSATGNPTGLAFPSSVGVAGGATDAQTPLAGLGTIPGSQVNPNFAVNLPAAVGTGSGGALGITLGSIANNANLSLRLSAMEETGTLRILSSPKILTLDNREAHIEQGTLIPYSQISAQGVQTAFKEAKLNLTVKPHVTADGSVLIALKVMRDEPDFNNTGARGDPTILKREAETELLVSDGHTAVIGGIFTRNHGTSYKKVPFFGDIPILGWLFKNRSDSDRRSEMLIFITPRIVNRAESIGQ